MARYRKRENSFSHYQKLVDFNVCSLRDLLQCLRHCSFKKSHISKGMEGEGGCKMAPAKTRVGSVTDYTDKRSGAKRLYR